MELDAYQWHDRIDELVAEGARIIAFRGAGTVNGIDPAAAESVAATVANYVGELAESGTTIALIFDGDEDNRSKPDIGSVFGSITDALKDKPNVVAITAQTKNWYYPKTDGGALATATGNPYETYVFPDDLPGSHAALTQSQALVSYPNYEQIFVGPVGPIALSQLKDLSAKAIGRTEHAGPFLVTIYGTPGNDALHQELEEQLAGAADEQSYTKVAAKIIQRVSKPYGSLFNADGKFAIDPYDYPGLEFSLILSKK